MHDLIRVNIDKNNPIFDITSTQQAEASSPFVPEFYPLCNLKNL